MWLGEQITERGVGNGMSLLIFAGIVVGLPRAVFDLLRKVKTLERGARSRLRRCIMLIALMIAVVAFIVFVERSERRIPVQYAKRVVGRKIMGGQSTHLPLRVNSGGVMPVIFASSLLTLPQTVGFFRQGQPVLRTADLERWQVGRAALHRCCTWSASSSSRTSTCRSSSIRTTLPTTCGSTVDSFRAFVRARGRRSYINEILTRITLVGALYLIMISLIPEWMIAGIHLNHLPVWLGGQRF